MRMDWSYPLLNSNVARGMLGFFVGSLLLFAIRHVKSTGHGRELAWSGFSAMLVLLGVAFAVGYDKFVGPTPLALVLVIFPLAILSSLEIPPLAWALSLRPLTFLGDLSYAVYLVHVPVQMVILALLRARHREAPVTSGLFLAEFLATVLVVAFAAHKLFEVPAREWVRGRFRASGGAERPVGCA
jgi:peptidoglycan/LPS O-acetylase OafA/YrhL